METKTKLTKLISNSLFLDPDRKLKLLELIRNSGDYEDEMLHETLKSEEIYFSKLLKSFIQQGGQNALDYLNQGFSKVAKTSNNLQEKLDRKKEESSLEDIIDQLND